MLDPEFDFNTSTGGPALPAIKGQENKQRTSREDGENTQRRNAERNSD
jgi:hypothetical protein